MKLKNAIILSALLLVAGFFAVNKYNASQLSTRANIAPNDSNHIVDEPKEFDTTTENTDKKAQTIAEAVSKIEGIDKASVIITGNSAIVGIEVTGELTDAKLIELKKRVESAAKEAETSLDHVAVTAGAELIKRIDKIADYKWDGEETNGLNEEQEKVVNSLTPAL